MAKRLNFSSAAGERSRPSDNAGVLGPAARRHAVPASAARGLFQSGSHGRAGPGDGLHDPGAAGAGQVGRAQPPPRGGGELRCAAGSAPGLGVRAWRGEVEK